MQPCHFDTGDTKIFKSAEKRQKRLSESYKQSLKCVVMNIY
jgi:hypothetical protein